jgi:hypothetical protein
MSCIVAGERVRERASPTAFEFGNAANTPSSEGKAKTLANFLLLVPYSPSQVDLERV